MAPFFCLILLTLHSANDLWQRRRINSLIQIDATNQGFRISGLL